MKVIYKAGPCSHKQCCPKGDTHLGVVELVGGVRFVRGGGSVDVADDVGKKMIADHPGMFAEEAKEKAVKPLPPRKA